jgi:hypothetical protein
MSLDVPDHVIDEFRVEGVAPELGDLLCQEIHLIGNVLGVDQAYAVQIVESSGVDQPLKLRLDSQDLVDEEVLISRRDATFQLIGYLVVERADFRERHLMLVIVRVVSRHIVCPPSFCLPSSNSVSRSEQTLTWSARTVCARFKVRCLSVPQSSTWNDSETRLRDAPLESVKTQR